MLHLKSMHPFSLIVSTFINIHNWFKKQNVIFDLHRSSVQKLSIFTPFLFGEVRICSDLKKDLVAGAFYFQGFIEVGCTLEEALDVQLLLLDIFLGDFDQVIKFVLIHVHGTVDEVLVIFFVNQTFVVGDHTVFVLDFSTASESNCLEDAKP